MKYEFKAFSKKYSTTQALKRLTFIADTEEEAKGLVVFWNLLSSGIPVQMSINKLEDTP